MALVSPGYTRSDLLRNLGKTQEKQIYFRGLNKRDYIEDGEMSDMLNVSVDEYPILAPRKPRGEYKLPEDVVRPLQIISRHNKLAILATDEDENVWFYYDGVKHPEVTGLTQNSRMVAINTKICFFPDRKYIECVADGDDVLIQNPGNLDASESVSSANVSISNTDARITLSENPGFKRDDAVDITGTLTYTPTGGNQTTMQITASCQVKDVENNTTLVLPRETFIELTGEGAAANAITLSGKVSREIGDDIEFDQVIEWNNRLWAASSKDNTIYACKLGDPTNWKYYQGTSLDSYYAQQGTDGAWTGVAAYSGHIIFFKANGMCRIYGTSPANYQITNTKCFGVEKGSSLSVVTINDVVYYKSPIGIMAYSGGVPVCISEKLGNTPYANVVGGSEGKKYYASIQRTGPDGGFSFLVYDIDSGFWHKEENESNRRICGCCAINDNLYVIKNEMATLVCSDTLYCNPYLVAGEGNLSGEIQIINPIDTTEKYEDIEWMAQFGPFHEYLESKKIYSQLSLRLIAKEEGKAHASIYISIDEGDWELVKTYDPVSTGGEIIPIIPRRCDRYSIKIEAQGNCEVVSLTRRVRSGTFGKL